jgi:PAS domain S-box-containing protein
VSPTLPRRREAPPRLAIPADLSRLAEVRAWAGEVGSSASLPAARVFDLQVSVSEAAANGIEHAASAVELVAWVLPDRLIIEITNDGVFQPGLVKGEGRRRGLGLPLMVSLADQVHVSRLESDRTKVSLTFFTAAREPSASGNESAPDFRSENSPRAGRFGSASRGRSLLLLLLLLLLLPLPLLIILAVVFYVGGIDGVHESAGLLTAFNTLFTCAAGLLVAYLAARTYRVGGSGVQLALGSGAIVLAVGSLLAGPLISDPNGAITVYNTAVLVAGALFLVAGSLALGSRSGIQQPSSRWKLALAYSAALAFVVVWAILASNTISSGVLPAFYVVGAGSTDVREAVLAVGVLFFVAASVSFALIYRRRLSRFALLASTSFGTFAVALGILALTEAPTGSPINWLARAGIWLSGAYLLAGAMSVDYGRGWLLGIERDLEETRIRYQGLVEVNPDAVWIRSEGRFVYANAAAAALLGYSSASELIGKDVDEAFHPETRDVQRERVAEVYAGGISPATDEMFLRADGSTVHASIFRTRVEYKGRLGVQAVARDITERKLAEEALKESEERTRLIAEAGRIGFVEWNAAKDTGYWSPEHQEILGCEPGSSMSWEQWLQGLHPEDRERVMANFSRLMDRARSEGRVRGRQDVYRFIRPDGSTVWVESDMSVDMVGDEPIIRGSVRDVTERKQAKEALRDSEATSRAILDATDDSVTLWSRSSGTIVAVNASAARRFGLPAESIVGRRLEDLLAPEQAQWRLQNLEEAADSARPLECEDQRGGFFFYHSLYPIVESDGHSDRVVTFSRDVTDAKRYEEALRESEANFRSLFEGSPDAIFMGTPGGPIIAANPAACTMFEMTEDELCAGGRAGIEDPDHPPSPAVFEERARTGKVRYEAGHVRKSGARFPSEVTSAIVDGGRRSIVMIRDISERRHAEEQMRRQLETLAQISDAVVATDLEFRITSWNKAAESMYGWPAEEAVGFLMSERVPTEYLEDEREKVTEDFRRDGSWHGEVVQTRRDGTKLVVLSSVVLSRDSEGKPTGVLAVNRDITGRRQAELEKQYAEAEVRALFDSPGVMRGIVEIVDDSTVLHVRDNHVTTDFTGVSAGAFDGKLSSDLGEPPEVIRLWVEHYREAERTGKPVTFEYRDPRGRGEGWLGATVSFLRTAPSGHAQFAYMVEDITERKRAEEALRESEARFKSLAENVSSVLMRYDRQLRVVYLSPLAAAVTGIPVDAFIGKTNREVGMPPELCDLWETAIGKVFETGTREEMEFSLPDEHHGVSTFLLKLGPEFGPGGGEVEYVLGVSTDITDRKRTEQALRATNEELQRFNNAAVDRELRVIGLKGEVNELLAKAGLPRRYSVDDLECGDEAFTTLPSS